MDRVFRATARLLAVMMILVTASAFAAEKARYSIEFIPQLKTSLGQSYSVNPMDMNDQGQVIGRAVGPFGPYAGFLFTPGRGMQQIDPSGLFTTWPWRINNLGQVVGKDLSNKKYGVFLYDPARGYLSLTPGLVAYDRDHFNFVDMNNAGVILAGAGKDGLRKAFPYRYTMATGWQDVTTIFPALKKFSKNGFSLTHINDNGDFTFYRRESDGFGHTYVYYAKTDTVVDLSRSFRRDHMNDFFNAGDINDFGSVIGTYLNASDTPVPHYNLTPYLYTPGTGLRNIRPPGKGMCEAFRITSDGTVVGYVNRAKSAFIYNKERGHKYVTEARLKAMLPLNASYRGLSIDALNDRREFIGGVYTVDAQGSETTGAYYLYSPRYGLIDLQTVVNELAPNHEIAEAVDLNNRGQILLQFRNSPQSAAILTPLN